MPENKVFVQPYIISIKPKGNKSDALYLKALEVITILCLYRNYFEQMKVLIVEDDVASQKYLEFVMKKEGYQYRTAENGAVGLDEYKTFSPDLILSDINMVEMNGLEMLQNIRETDRKVMVIMMTAFNSEDYVIDSIKLGANNYLKKPIKKDNLVSLLRSAEMDLKKRSKKILAQSDIFEDTLSFNIDTKVHLVPAAVEFLSNEVSHLFDHEIWLDIKVGLSELLMNAIEHGNMGITFEQKTDALLHNSLNELYDERLKNKQIASRTVFVYYAMSEKYCEWVIEDQGEGFDHYKYKNKIGPEQLESLHGRGIFICQRYFDEIEYIGNGNKVRVKKYI